MSLSAFLSVRGLCVANALAVVIGGGTAHAQNVPPTAPTVLEPENGRTVNRSDVHMEAAPFSDPNPGDTHLCSDWEIWYITGPGGNLLERHWYASCVTGASRVHIHLADGTYDGEAAGPGRLYPEFNYRMRARFRDNSGHGPTEWSAWSSADFVTAPNNEIAPLVLHDVLSLPMPQIRNGPAGIVPLPSAGTASSIRVEHADGSLMLRLTGGNNGRNIVTNPGPAMLHHPARVVVEAGSNTLNIPACTLYFTSDDNVAREVYLPAISLSPGQVDRFWVSLTGATYQALLAQTEPDFTTQLASPLPWVLTPDFKIDVVSTGFQLPVSIVFLPSPGPDPTDPLYYVVELYGTIKVVTRNGTVSTYATDLLNFDVFGGFPGSGELGSACLAVDPLNGDLYVTMVYSSNPLNPEAPLHPAVDKFTSTDGGMTAATRTRVLDMAPELMSASHQVSNISFGPDGHLYVHVGDGFDIAAGQNLDRFGGKVVRVLRSGQPVTTNPFYNPSNGITARDYVYAYGLRNPFGGDWRTLDNAHYIVENGPNVDRFTKMVAGQNYLYDGSDASMALFALYNWDPAVGPVQIAFLQDSTFSRSGFPAAYEGRAYVTQSGSTYDIGPGQPIAKSVTEFIINGSGVLTSGPRAVAYYQGIGASSAVGLGAGPDGLYFSEFYKEDSFNPIEPGSRIFRLRHAGSGPVDCNGNGVVDTADLASEYSDDCNNNGIPDECDIAGGTSADVNADGRPDECLCAADLDADGVMPANPDGSVDINDLLFFLGGFEEGFIEVDVDDDGLDPAMPDGTVDLNDLLFFLYRYEIGC